MHQRINKQKEKVIKLNKGKKRLSKKGTTEGIKKQVINNAIFKEIIKNVIKFKKKLGRTSNTEMKREERNKKSVMN